MSQLPVVDGNVVQAGRTVRPLTMRQQQFMDSTEAAQARSRLERMVADPAFNTEAITFVAKHMQYMCEHPKTSIDHYLSNLRLKTRVR